MGLVMDEAIGPDIVCFSGRSRMQEPSSRRRLARFGWRSGSWLSEASCGALRFFVQRRSSGPRCDLNRRVGMVSGLSPENLARGRETLARGRPPTRAFPMCGHESRCVGVPFQPILGPIDTQRRLGSKPQRHASRKRSRTASFPAQRRLGPKPQRHG